MSYLLEHVSEQCFCQQSRMTARAVTRRYGAAFASVGLEATEFSLLAALALGRSASIAGLADHLAFERTTLVRNLQRMASRGLIRAADTRSRSLRYVLTPLGEDLLKKALPLWAGVQAAVQGQLKSNEAATALKSMAALRRATEKCHLACHAFHPSTQETIMSVASEPVLVIGATGRHGGTGAVVARLLRERGLPVRALTRNADARVAPLRSIGVEVVTGDLQDRRSLKVALEGVSVAYFTYPIAEGIVEAAANFASAGRAAGLKRVVVMSMGASHPDSPSHLGRAQWLAEETLEWAGFSCLHLRIAAFFFENLALLHRADIAAEGVMRNSYADVAVSWISGEDAGKLAVAALLHPERFGSEAAVYPSGSRSYSQGEIAQLVGRYLGRPVRHETISREAWRERLVALSAHDDRINNDMAGHISALGAAIRQARPSNDMFEAVMGEKSLSLPEALASGRLSFS